MLVLGFGVHGFGGVHVHGNRRGRRVEGAQATDIVFHRHVGLGTVEHLKLTVRIAREAPLELAELVLGLRHAAGHGLHVLGCRGKGEDDILGLVLKELL